MLALVQTNKWLQASIPAMLTPAIYTEVWRSFFFCLAGVCVPVRLFFFLIGGYG